MNSRLHPGRTTSGLPVTGHGGRTDTTGFPDIGWRRRTWARCGRRATGDLGAGSIASITASGGCTSGSMAASTTGLDTQDMGTTAATGTAATSSTTRPTTGWTGTLSTISTSTGTAAAAGFPAG